MHAHNIHHACALVHHTMRSLSLSTLLSFHSLFLVSTFTYCYCMDEDQYKKAQEILQLILDGLSPRSAEDRPLEHGANATSRGDVGACSSSPATQTAPATQIGEGNRHGFVSKVIYGRIKSNCDAIVMHCLPAVCMLSHGIAVVGYATKIRII